MSADHGKEILALLREVRGTFPALVRETRVNRVGHWALILLFGLVGLGLSAAALLSGDGLAKKGWTWESVVLVLMIPVCLICCWFCWKRQHDVYEFTEERIAMWNRGKLCWSVSHAELEAVEVWPDHDHFAMTLQSRGRKQEFPMPKALHAVLREKARGV